MAARRRELQATVGGTSGAINLNPYLTPEFRLPDNRLSSFDSSQCMPSNAFTISKFADAVGVNIETIRYYQRRGLLDEPSRRGGGFRSYDATHVRRLQFIKRAQELGFSLDDAAELLAISRTTDRRRVREVTRSRVADIRQKIHHLQSMADALENLADCCARTDSDQACPIVAALAGDVVAPHERQSRRKAAAAA